MSDRDTAYDQIDRFLRNNLDDTDYADYSQALDLIYTAAPVVAALEKLLRAEEKYVRDTGLPQPDDLIQDAVNEARAVLGWPALGVLGMDGWSSERPNADGRWLWREGGKEHREVELVLCSGGAEVADAGEVEEGAPQYYWQRTPTNEHFMPGLWKRAPGVAVGHPPSLYDLVPPSAAEWLSDVPPGTPSGAASTDWHQGWDACRNRCRTLVDNALASKEPHPAPTTPGVGEVPRG